MKGQPRIGIIGAGAMGSSLAAITSRFAPTVLVCRNPKRAGQIFKNGIRCTGALELQANPIIVSSAAQLSEVGGVKYLFIAVKTTAIEQVCEELEPLRDSIVQPGFGEVKLISYQNGIDPGLSIMNHLDTSDVMRMVLKYGAVLDEQSGDVEITMLNSPHYIGCLDESLSGDCRYLSENLTKVGFETQYIESINSAVWSKALINAAINPLCALVNADIGSVLESPSRELFVRMLDEGSEVARAEGIDLGAGFCQRAIELVSKSAHHLPSMVDDIQNGRPSEVGQLNRQIVNRARALGVDAPTHEVIDALIETFDWRIYHRDQS
jgi:2-dehydropantoate 2-reductase